MFFFYFGGRLAFVRFDATQQLKLLISQTYAGLNSQKFLSASGCLFAGFFYSIERI
jgi:hypothetical protein